MTLTRKHGRFIALPFRFARRRSKIGEEPISPFRGGSHNSIVKAGSRYSKGKAIFCVAWVHRVGIATSSIGRLVTMEKFVPLADPIRRAGGKRLFVRINIASRRGEARLVELFAVTELRRKSHAQTRIKSK